MLPNLSLSGNRIGHNYLLRSSRRSLHPLGSNHSFSQQQQICFQAFATTSTNQSPQQQFQGPSILPRSSSFKHQQTSFKQHETSSTLSLSSLQTDVQLSHDLCARIESVVATPIRPLSINELLTLHTGSHCEHSSGTIPSPDSDGRNNGGDDKTSLNVQTVNEQQQAPSHQSDRKGWERLLLRSANWARVEISVRLAHRLHDFSRLPFVVVSNPDVFEVFQLYCHAFECLMDFGDIKTLEDEDRFTQQLKDIVTAHGNVVSLMQRGISQLKQNHKIGISLDTFLDRLFGTRIGNRVLAETHLALHDNPEWFDHGTTIVPTQSTLGVIQRRCRPSEVLDDVASKVQQVAMYTYGCFPEVSLEGELDLSFPYIPEHLRFICFEILKNSIRATVENHIENKAKGSLPPVHVGVHKGQTDVVIKVTDEGGGLNPDLHDAIWQYGFSTVSPPLQNEKVKVTINSHKQMAGYGFGLPLSRLYARYWGGNLDTKFMPGYGTDTYIFLPRLGNQRESEEMLNNYLYWTTLRSTMTIPTNVV